MNNKIVAGIAGVVVIVGLAFYGGMAYGKSASPTRGQFGNGQLMGNLDGARGSLTKGGMNGGGITFGEIISKDAGSVTIKMQDGSTKIVLVATSTQIMKSLTGSLNDLTNGINVTITGTTNSDGSVSAQSVQIRPEGFTSFGGPPRTNQ
ncbi:MAG: hypothetical protein A3C06_03370 [Candidatus Taylorbacteria bacterium RIFCSPHIGHO2_02_FULL_46_13]|uniref:DUF5666 domain-containing protein n=1 Tax=Candidatus Taylorbacteria bacterium RIFCSPHIGHO2_02_FULL_46_13 TaxID=1802312 RepID=A0A1G2MUA3_9BACT|nr:MAG: hypothetical protein A3C06_03370 [Candidatus Taylorbacteria bacterium RIFCSPHIGHO2_02_FULL_46_13]